MTEIKARCFRHKKVEEVTEMEVIGGKVAVMPQMKLLPATV